MVFDVFISYPHQDKAMADATCAKLEAEGIRCWLAPRDISPGADWAASIVDAIDGCRVMVLIFSGHTEPENNRRPSFTATRAPPGLMNVGCSIPVGICGDTANSRCLRCDPDAHGTLLDYVSLIRAM
jgi:hypothetical protein